MAECEYNPGPVPCATFPVAENSLDLEDKLLAFHAIKLITAPSHNGNCKGKGKAKAKAKATKAKAATTDSVDQAREVLLSLFSQPAPTSASTPESTPASTPESTPVSTTPSTCLGEPESDDAGSCGYDADGFVEAIPWTPLIVVGSEDTGCQDGGWDEAVEDDDDDDDDDDRIYGDLCEDDDAEYLFALDSSYERALVNNKRGERYVRSTHSNRKPKPPRPYVRSRDHKRTIEHKAYMQEFFERRKENARLTNAKMISLRPYRYSNGNTTYLDSTFVDALPPGITIDPSQRHLTRSGQHMRVLPPHIRNAIMALQFKEVLTSNDYELLLMLDETVAPKTLSQRQINMHPIVLAQEEDVLAEQRCMICLGAYNVGDKLRRLACKHEFHVNCIDAWLLHSSERCPLDNLNLS